MDPWIEIIHWTYAFSVPPLALLAFLAWRGRTTALGRAYLVFVWSAAVATCGLVLATSIDTDGPIVAPLIGATFVLLATLLLRLATLAAVQGRALTLREEAFVWIPPMLILGISAPQGAAAWSSLCFGVVAIRWSQVQLKSWGGFKVARGGAMLASLVPGMAALAWVIEPSTHVAAIGVPLVATMLCTTLFYALPRMGLSSTDQVHSSTIIEAMSDGVFVVDLHGRIVDCNQAAAEILNLENNRLSLRHLNEALAHHPDLVELLDGAIDGRTVYTPACEEGEQASTYDLQLSALCDSTGAIQSRVVVLRDISDRIEVENESRRQARHVRLVHEVSAAVHEAETIEAGLHAAIALIASTMEYPIGQFLAIREEDDLNRLTSTGVFYVDRFVEGAAQVEAVLRAEAAAAAERGEVSDGAKEPGGGSGHDAPGSVWWREFGFHAILTVPILIGKKLYGVCEFFSTDPIQADEQTTDLLEHLGELAGRAIERKLAEERIRVLAYRDDLTGLPNRQRFHQLLAGAVSHAKRSKRRMALLFLDLDGFKKVNDTLGHEVGDHLLAEVANRFSGVVRSSDHLGRHADGGGGGESAISRLGGDEFTVVLTEIQQPADAALVAERLLATLERPVVLAGQEIFVGTSIGIGIFPDDGEEADRLLRNADAAMYFAKGRGRNGYQFYSEELNRDQECRLEIESRLRGAVERGEFMLHYQPLLSSDTGEIVAAEALLRWVNRDLGFVSPEDFIPVAEDSGLIVELGAWVFRTACQQVRLWLDGGHKPIRIGVNVSGHQIREAGMVEMVGSALAESEIPPDLVELEITESTIMQDDALTVQTLGDLRRMGVGLALDDFGTGYSSLSYLRRFPIDRVKIDRSFVNELPGNADDAALTSAIIAMAHGLRLKVVAEGVETANQALFLEGRGCDELQGYLFGRPCAPEEFEDLLRAKPRPPRELAKDEA